MFACGGYSSSGIIFIGGSAKASFSSNSFAMHQLKVFVVLLQADRKVYWCKVKRAQPVPPSVPFVNKFIHLTEVAITRAMLAVVIAKDGTTCAIQLDVNHTVVDPAVQL